MISKEPIDIPNSTPNPNYCASFGCPGCKTIREAMQKHMKNSDLFTKCINGVYDKEFKYDPPR